MRLTLPHEVELRKNLVSRFPALNILSQIVIVNQDGFGYLV